MVMKTHKIKGPAAIQQQLIKEAETYQVRAKQIQSKQRASGAE